MRQSASLAKKLEKRRCTHNPAVSATECIKQVIGAHNKDHYCVATQDPELRLYLRDIPGTPLIYMNNSATVLEPVSSATTARVKELELKKMRPLDFEIKPKKEPRVGPVHKKRKVKAPNPLSVKKPKRKEPEPVDKSDGEVKKRKRRRTKIRVE